MGREYFWKPGSWYVIDDRSGFRVRVERAKKEWQGLLVADRFWEPRNFQDFVKGVRDDQTVPEARPRPTIQYTGLAQSTLAAAALKGDNFVIIASPFSYQLGDVLGITLNFDKGVVFLTTVTSLPRGDDFNSDENSDFGPNTGAIGIYPPFPGDANSGNWVVDTSTPQITPQSYGSSSGG